MSKRFTRPLTILLATAAMFLVPVGTPKSEAQEGLGERIGAELDEGISRLSEEFREGWASLKQAVDKMGVQGRVYSRLRWDKQLSQADLDVDVEEGGIVALGGTVADETAKQKALQLAQDTVGVNRVIDRLTVPTVE